ncbi:hypothetical protein LTR62_000298 [Meristemomyces frigidus]|uniref:F-box domain-containing protein n=1 Tax=Meristemomyces frigidus TaxID=1508187 RepID=A0AAN7TQL2_9PEZI|nr:hypothetical protein LTR62_000298 [Meristemomyces frigidus]
MAQQQDHVRASGVHSVGDIPHFAQFTSPVSTGRMAEGFGLALPLNIVALIVQWLDDTGDLARVCRTCRLLNYMTSPLLYQRVTLHSYPEIRYVRGRPEGFGGGSPFVMALNGLVTRSQAELVEDFKLWGGWNEAGQEEFAKGRVPDNSMMLNILLRAATDKMANLRSFCWELDCKPLKTLYQGLAAHTTLTSLTIRFPTSRVPRPSVMIPPIPNLRAFKALDIDPLCYPDDISMLLLHSRKLEDLRLHFSSRMRREAEPTLTLDTYFGRCLRAKYSIKVKHVGLQNFFGANMTGMEDIFDKKTALSMCALDMFGGAGSRMSTARNVYIDDSWRQIDPDMACSFKSMRSNEVAMQHVELLKRNQVPLEAMYFISGKNFEASAPDRNSPITPEDTPLWQDEEMTRLGKDYLHVLTTINPLALRKLLLRDEWALNEEEVSRLVRNCPNLEQLGMAVGTKNVAVMSWLMPFLPKLRAFRMLPCEALTEIMQTTNHEQRMSMLGIDLWKTGMKRVEFLGFGEIVYKVGNAEQFETEDGRWQWRYQMTTSSKEEVQHIELWGLDNLDISAEPVARFAP